MIVMLDPEKNQKLVELTTRAVSISEELLKEEKQFIDALSRNVDLNILEETSRKISLLLRKEILYNGAARCLLLNLSRG
jgi:hypothetical protein